MKMPTAIRSLCLTAIIALLTACSAPAMSPASDIGRDETAPVPAIMHSGVIHTMTIAAMPAEIDESAIIGKVKSVDKNLWPAAEGEANIPYDGAPYAKCSDGIAVLIGSEWALFEPNFEHDPYGAEMSTPKA